MIDTLVIATDGSESGERADIVALDLARRFDATVHALSVVDTTDGGGDDPTGGTEDRDEDDAESEREDEAGGDGDDEDDARRKRAEEAVAAVARRADREVHTAVREGAPADVVRAYAEECGADIVATGTRGRHGAHRFLLGSVAEDVVRTCPVPVLTVRQLASDA